MATPASANILTQLAVEATPGAGGAPTQQLAGLYFTDDPKINTMQARPQGHALPTSSVRGQGYTDLTLASDYGCFNALTYALASILGPQAAVLHTGGTTAHDWPFAQKLVNMALGKTYALQRGSDAGGRGYNFVAIDALTLSGTKDKMDISGHAFGREIQADIALTAGVPLLPCVSMAGINVNLFLDLTSAGIGATALVASEWSVAISNVYGMKNDVTRAQTSYDKLVPTVPEIAVTFKVEANDDAWAFFNYLKSGQLVYPRIDVQGPVVAGESTIKNQLTLDMAMFVTAPAAFGDDQAVDSVVFTGKVGEDPNFGVNGTGLLATLTNALSAL